MSNDAGKPRLEALDALRGLAALSVVLLHFTTDFHRDLSPVRISALSWTIGNYGVHLFFLISGFVILMTAEKARRPRDFVVSRFSRLYPPYWVALALTTTVCLVLPVEGTPDALRLLRRAAVDLTMFQGWVGIASVDSVYWTLQVEMSFYLILLVLIWRRAVDRVLLVMTALVVVAVVDQLFVPRPWGAVHAHVRQLLLLEHVHLFTAGIIVHKLRHGFKHRYLFLLALCVVSPATANYFPHHPWQDTLMVISLTAIMYLATTGRMKWLVCRPLLYLGNVSYSLYLSHHWIGLLFLKYADNAGIEPNLALAAAVTLCLLLATLMTRFVERPSLRWIRGRFSAAHSIRPVVVAA